MCVNMHTLCLQDKHLSVAWRKTETAAVGKAKKSFKDNRLRVTFPGVGGFAGVLTPSLGKGTKVIEEHVAGQWV